MRVKAKPIRWRNLGASFVFSTRRRLRYRRGPYRRPSLRYARKARFISRVRGINYRYRYRG